MRICQSNFTSWKKISNCNRSVELRYDIIICNFLQKDPCGMIKGHSFWNIIVFLAHICPFFLAPLDLLVSLQTRLRFLLWLGDFCLDRTITIMSITIKTELSFFFVKRKDVKKYINRSDRSLKDFRPKIFKLTRPHDGLGTRGKIFYAKMFTNNLQCGKKVFDFKINFFLKTGDLLRSENWGKFVKLCLRSSHIVQNSFYFDEFLNRTIQNWNISEKKPREVIWANTNIHYLPVKLGIEHLLTANGAIWIKWAMYTLADRCINLMTNSELINRRNFDHLSHCVHKVESSEACKARKKLRYWSDV